MATETASPVLTPLQVESTYAIHKGGTSTIKLHVYVNLMAMSNAERLWLDELIELFKKGETRP